MNEDKGKQGWRDDAVLDELQWHGGNAYRRFFILGALTLRTGILGPYSSNDFNLGWDDIIRNKNQENQNFLEQ